MRTPQHPLTSSPGSPEFICPPRAQSMATPALLVPLQFLWSPQRRGTRKGPALKTSVCSRLPLGHQGPPAFVTYPACCLWPGPPTQRPHASLGAQSRAPFGRGATGREIESLVEGTSLQQSLGLNPCAHLSSVQPLGKEVVLALHSSQLCGPGQVGTLFPLDLSFSIYKVKSSQEASPKRASCPILLS